MKSGAALLVTVATPIPVPRQPRKLCQSKNSPGEQVCQGSTAHVPTGATLADSAGWKPSGIPSAAVAELKYLVENGPRHCARIAGHLKEGPHANDHNQGTDDVEDCEALSPHHREPSRHRALCHRTWDQGSRTAVWLGSEDGPRLATPLAGGWPRGPRPPLFTHPSMPDSEIDRGIN